MDVTRVRWLSVQVYRPADFPDCTRGGVSSRHSKLYVPHLKGNHEAPPEGERLVLSVKAGVRNFVPFAIADSGRWSMFGGNFVWSSDARFRDWYGDVPLPVHDRLEEFLPTRKAGG